MGEIAIVDAVATLPQAPGADATREPGGVEFANSLKMALDVVEGGVSAQNAFASMVPEDLTPAQIEAIKAVALENITAANIPDDLLQALLTGAAGLKNTLEPTKSNDAGDNVQTAAELLQWLQALVAGMVLPDAPVAQEAKAAADAAVSTATAPVPMADETPAGPVEGSFMGTAPQESPPADGAAADSTAARVADQASQVPPVPTESGPASQPQDVPAPPVQAGDGTPVAQAPAATPDAVPVPVVERLGTRADAPKVDKPQAGVIQVAQAQASQAPGQAPGPEQTTLPTPTGALTAASAAGQASMGESVVDAKRTGRQAASLERPIEVTAISSETLQTEAGSAGTGRTAGVSADQQRLIDRVSTALQQAAANGRTTVRLRLYPPELGTVRIEVSMFRGSVTARIETSTAEAHHILGTHIGTLQENIRQAGVDLGRVEVNHREVSMQFGLGQQPRDRDGYQPFGQPATPRSDVPVEAVDALQEGDIAATAGILDVIA